MNKQRGEGAFVFVAMIVAAVGFVGMIMMLWPQ
jgi:hypothetical protein